MESLFFDDWNFDGFLDFSLTYHGFHATAYFLWDTTKNLFIRNWELENLGGRYKISVCYETKRLKIFGGRMNLFFVEYFEYINDEITMVKAIEEWHEFIEVTESGYLFTIHFTYRELVDGEMIVVNKTEHNEIWGR